MAAAQHRGHAGCAQDGVVLGVRGHRGECGGITGARHQALQCGSHCRLGARRHTLQVGLGDFVHGDRKAVRADAYQCRGELVDRVVLARHARVAARVGDRQGEGAVGFLGGLHEGGLRFAVGADGIGPHVAVDHQPCAPQALCQDARALHRGFLVAAHREQHIARGLVALLAEVPEHRHQHAQSEFVVVHAASEEKAVCLG